MTFDYAGLRDRAVQPLIKRFGKVTTAKLLSPGAPTSGQPAWDPEPGADIEQPVQVVKTNVTIKDTEGTLVEMTDEAYLVSPEGVTVDPELADRIEVDGSVLQIIMIKPLKPGPVTMLWKVFARN